MPSDLGVSEDGRDKVLLEAPKVDRTATELERLLGGPTRPEGVVEALRELDRCLVADVVAHTDDDLDVSADDLCLDLGETGIEDDAPDVVGTQLEQPTQRTARDDLKATEVIDEG